MAQKNKIRKNASTTKTAYTKTLTPIDQKKTTQTSTSSSGMAKKTYTPIGGRTSSHTGFTKTLKPLTTTSTTKNRTRRSKLREY